MNVISARRLGAQILPQAQPRCRLWTARIAGQFAIYICSIAIMSNHVVVRNRPDIAGQWSDAEVARRW